MKERISEFIREKAYRPMTCAELATAMGIPEKQQEQLAKTLAQMEATGEVVRTRLDRYGAPERMNLAVGRLQGHPKGFGFLVQDEPGTDDIFIGRESLNGAWHGDRIIARLSPPARTGGRVEGEVIRILNRATNRVVGTFEAAKNGGFLTPDDRRLTEDIVVAKGATNGAKSGEKVVVEVIRFPEARRHAEGKIVERLGMKGEVGVDILSVIRKFGLPELFPPRVLKEAESIPETVQESSLAEENRRDLREWTIVTIDGEDAKDLDDAINVEKVAPGRWRLGVHIADVAYYVREGSVLDQEAYKRGTSVYLADRVVPMLPPRLSNGICSLNPQVDRLTISCVMEINQNGQVLNYEIFPSVIRTAARMTYTRVNEILAGHEDARAEYRPLVPMFTEMLALMEVLRVKRSLRGALDFDLPEAKVKLNDSGWPIEIQRIDRGVAERLIEEFMLVANETVAEHCFNKVVPFMYRVHGEPAADRAAGLRDFLALFGYALKLPRDGAVLPKLLQAITEWSKGRPEEYLVNSVLLRTMRQAIYSAENLGHFGLAAEFYCHFTSPIRRYPDLVVHRVLRAMATAGLNAKVRSKWERWMPDAAKQSSERERVAVEAERETLDLKKAEYMSTRVGERFEGLVSGVGQFGFFVQLPTTVEGLVHVSSLTDDYYHFHEKYYALIGERTRRRFRLGDPVTVQLTRVDIENRQIDFALDMEENAVLTVATVPSEMRSRAPKKQALMGVPAQPAASSLTAEAGERPTRKRKRRKSKRGPEQTDATVRAAAEDVSEPFETVRLNGPAKAMQPQGGAKATPLQRPADATPLQGPADAAQSQRAVRVTKPHGPARAVQPGPVEVTQSPGPRTVPPKESAEGVAEKPPVPRQQSTPEDKSVRSARTGTKRGRPSERESGALPQRSVGRSERAGGKDMGLDMWGVPVPEGRGTRLRMEEDPGVVNPFSIAPPPRSGVRNSKSTAEGPSAPAPSTADESSGLFSVMDGSGVGAAGRGRRTPRSRTQGRMRSESQPATPAE